VPTLPFHELPNLLMTARVSGWTEGMIGARSRVTAENIARTARGEPPRNAIDLAGSLSAKPTPRSCPVRLCGIREPVACAPAEITVNGVEGFIQTLLRGHLFSAQLLSGAASEIVQIPFGSGSFCAPHKQPGGMCQNLLCS
jgi:hypothetical protein